MCNAKIMARRAVEIGAAVATWQAAGGSVGFVTMTMRHRRGQGLAGLWEALSHAWHRATSGKYWMADRNRHGVAGWLRVVEVTRGDNGWHVHVHALLFFEPSSVAVDLAALHASMFGRWSAGLTSRGLLAPLMVGQDARLIDGPADAGLASYFTKAVHGGHRVGMELTYSQTKRARKAHGTRPVWSLLDDVIDLGDVDALNRWHEWEKGSKNRRQLTWAQGLRARLGLMASEATDEEIAAEECGSADDDLLLIDAAGWSLLVGVPALIPLVLEAAEAGGLSGLRAFLDVHGVTYTTLGEQGIDYVPIGTEAGVAR